MISRHLLKTGVTLCGAVVAPQVAVQKKGWQEVKEIFTIDEYGKLSNGLNSILQTTFITGFFGACYGGFLQSREAYLNFIERNHGTKFTDQYDAKKKLQDFVTVNFAKGAVHWGWRLALFSGLYVTSVTVMSAYDGENKILHFVGSGLIAGGVYRMNMGLRGMIAGGTLGSLIGLLAGSVTLLILRLSGSTLDDVQKWQTDMAERRERQLLEASAKKTAAMNKETHSLLVDHDKNLGKN